MTVVPEGIEPPALVDLPAKEQRPTIVWCARHVPYKRPMDLVEAATRLQATIPDLQVWMIGGGPLLEKVRAAAPAGVEVLGRVSEEEKLDRMARAHVHVVDEPARGLGTGGQRGRRRWARRPWPMTSPACATPPSLPVARSSHRPRCARRVAALGARDLEGEPIEPIPYGGAHSWAFVAQQVLSVALAKSGLDTTFGPLLSVVPDAA